MNCSLRWQPNRGSGLTMVYATHDAFRRDVTLLMSTTGDDFAADSAFAAGWSAFKDYLRVHQTAEGAMCPGLRSRLAGLADVSVLRNSEAENSTLDRMIEAVDLALRSRSPVVLRERIEDLSKRLLAHLDHQEKEVLPMLSKVLTRADWETFRTAQRRALGPRAETYVPWLLDGAPEDTRRKVLAALPPPLRLMCRTVWLPRYRRNSPWRQIKPH
ncbi:hemerythrin domain-containing protein [Streptomyces sp. 184]|uniref:hemerythrin domain-containing protein n=1 Tax=Streptomyces sp. 184 TaxID=1827526 RepID=UPI003891F044